MSTIDETFAALRGQLRDSCLAGGVPVHAVDELVDIGLHAAQRAQDVIFDTARAASSPAIATAALGIALPIAIERLEAVRRNYVGQAKGSGGKTASFNLTVGGAAK